MQKKRGFLLLLIGLVTLLTVSVASAQTPTTFAGGWPYQQPPTGHFNVFATNAMLTDGIYYDVMNPPLAVYHWATGKYEGELADTFSFDSSNNYVVKLKPNITWSDGTPVTSQDLVTTFEMEYMRSAAVWQSISKVEVVDNLTAKFTVTTPSAAVERYILIEHIAPTSVYGDLAKQADALITGGKKSGDADFDALAKQIADFRPTAFVADGPYKLDPSTITAQSLTLVKNPGGYNADVVKFDQVLLWNGETETVTPLVAAGQLDYGTYGFPPATEKSFTDAGIDIIRGPGHTGPAIYLNFKDYPFSKVEVRQAIAYVVDRDQAGSVSLGKSGVAVQDMAGMSDSLVSTWVSQDVQSKLNTYDQDTDKATALLKGIGFTQDSSGKWMDDKGNPLAFTLKFPSDYTDWSATAENVTEQLNNFGFNITASGEQSTQVQPDVFAGNFQMAIQGWGASSPFPGFSYLVPYQTYDGTGVSVGQTGAGIAFDTKVTYSGGSLDVLDAANKSLQGLDTDAQKKLVDQLAQSFNELLPIIPMWERYANNPLNRKHLNAPADDDPIYQNPWSGADAFMPYLIMQGKVSPAS